MARIDSMRPAGAPDEHEGQGMDLLSGPAVVHGAWYYLVLVAALAIPLVPNAALVVAGGALAARKPGLPAISSVKREGPPTPSVDPRERSKLTPHFTRRLYTHRRRHRCSATESYP
ncbi:hypothetical protein [Streptomyces venetus]|uniref:hypothetical protein n=1 Tax=Streptomyces venetus TaxID=1701086 RepID=UPI003C2D66D8